jgi:cell division protein FtsB
MSFLQIVFNFSGLLSLIFVIAGGIFAARFSGKNQATNTATEAQEKAMNAMEARLNVQEKNINDLAKENARLYLIFDTIKAALKNMGMAVTIDGEMVIIHDGKNSVTTPINGTRG